MFRGGCVILTGVFHISGNNNNIRERRKNDIFRLNVTAGIRFNINKFKQEYLFLVRCQENHNIKQSMDLMV